VFHDRVEKNIKIRKNQTIREFKAKVIEEFALLETAPENARIRAYDSFNDYFKEPYAGENEDKTFEELKIFNYKVLGLECKKPEENFSTYDPNLI